MLPKLRPLDVQLITYENRPALLLRDRLELSGRAVVLSTAMAPVLALADGTRDPGRIRAALALTHGIDLPLDVIEGLFQQLDEALLLESERYEAALAALLAEYRAAPCRPPALAGASYPAEPEALAALFEGFLAQTPVDGARDDRAVRGVICPHIDYERGAPTYAQVWQRAAPALAEADVVVLFGTDHMGDEGTLTPTHQRYATPWGTLPLAEEALTALAQALGEETAFREELHHRSEHSLELAANWVHFFRREQPPALLPVLCGSFAGFVAGAEPGATYERAFQALRESLAGKRTLVVAAADLAHVGPAFGDPRPLAAADKAALGRNDERRLAAALAGSAEGFLEALRRDGDRQRVCGLPPIYFALGLLGEARGELTGYAQCPADEQGGSLVSVAGAIFK
ncbi:MAG: AmmeMemoRadiSam system protein B [Chloroflexota bacterium]